MIYRCNLLLLLAFAGCSDNHKGEILASGTIEGTTVTIGSEVAGKVKEIRANEGTRVMKGDTLLIIDDAEYKIQLRQAAANFESFEATYRLTLEGSRKEDVLQAEAAYSTAEADYHRMKDLIGTLSITQKQYDDAYNKYISAQQNFEKMKQGSRREEINAARQKKDLAEAQVDLLKKKNRDCVIISPTAGMVTLKAVEAGELVMQGSNLFRIAKIERMKLMIYVNETDLGKIKLGEPAKVSIDADPGKEYDGVVTFISPFAEFTPKNVQTKEERTKLVFGVKIEVANPDGALKSGLPADVRIIPASSSGK